MSSDAKNFIKRAAEAGEVLPPPKREPKDEKKLYYMPFMIKDDLCAEDKLQIIDNYLLLSTSEMLQITHQGVGSISICRAGESFSYGRWPKKILNKEEVRAEVKLIADEISIIDMLESDKRLKMYNSRANARQDLTFDIIEGTQVRTHNGIVVSKVPLNGKGLYDGIEEWFFLLCGQSLLHRYWCNGVKISNKEYFTRVSTALTEAGLYIVDLHCTITAF